jgi:ABC-type transport system involved in cytochrome c biogenesis permease subunit
LPVQHDGRVPPLDTLARDMVESVTGEAFWQGHDPVLLLLAWTWDPATWMHQPVIAIESGELRQELHLSATKTVFSYVELSGHRYLHTLLDQFRHRPEDRKPNPLESKVSDIYEKLTTLQHVFSGRAIRPIPDPESVGSAWQAIDMVAPAELQEADPVQTAWMTLRSAFLADDRPAFAAASDELTAALRALPAAYRPSTEQIDIELRYNRLRAFRTAWIAMVAGVAFALLALVCELGRSTTAKVLAKITRLLAFAGMLAGFAVLTYGLWLRWQIAGRIPAANMFESLLFLSWGAGAFGIVSLLVLHDRFVPLTASTMGALALILADCLPLDHYVRPIVPVLQDTVWMSIHVPIIMVSYAVLAVAVLIAHGQLALMAVVPRRRELAAAVDLLHYWYVFVGALLLLAGIITGSMWGASSWGRYWGWDPKEVWSLVAFLGYLAILHVRVDHQRTAPWAYAIGALLGIALFALVLPKLGPLTPLKSLAFAGTATAAIIFVVARGPFATALKSILAFWLIIMTYVGVNYVLGIGLHSYGFGTGAVVRWMFLVGGIDLALIAVCCIIYLARTTAQLLPAPT